MSEQGNGFVDQLGRFFGGFFKFTIRLVFVLVLAIGVGAGLFFGITRGIPALERAFFQPVRENSVALAGLEARATQSAAQSATQMASLQERLTALEIQNDSEGIALGEIEAQVATLMPLLQGQADLFTGLDGAQAEIESLQDGLSSLQSDSDSDRALVQERLDALAADLETVQETLAANDFPVADAYADLQLAKILTLLTRVQVFLFQENPGLARTDVETARDMLLTYQSAPEFADIDLLPVITRLDLALESIAERPDRALNDIEIAWGLLLEGIRGDGLQAASDPAQGETDELPTPTPTATPEP
jgi:hypothetical protein